ncbi:SpoIID/LytB domain-containing protein [candidate division FCPU426 bacterium]|nr:SpoIID/LytB domain-containing protein [candidate division FCPU426 bacterium]
MRDCTHAIGILLTTAAMLGLFPHPLQSGGRVPSGDRQRALVAFYQGDYQAAAEEYGYLLDKEPQDQDLARDLFACLMALHEHALAEKALARAGIRGREMAEVKIAAGEYTGAIRELERMLAQPGMHDHARLLLGCALYCQGKYAKAAEMFWQAKAEGPAQGTSRLFLGRAFRHLAMQSSTEGEYFTSRAKQEFGKAVEIDPSLWQVHRDLALFAEHNQEWTNAYKQWRKVRSVIGASREVQSAISRVQSRIPTPTQTPVPTTVIAAAAPPLPGIDEIAVQPLPLLKNADEIRVGLRHNLPCLAFGGVGDWQAEYQPGKPFWKGTAKSGYRLEPNPSGGWDLKNWQGKRLKHFRRRLFIRPVDPKKPLVVINLYQTTGYLWSVGRKKSRYYRGQLVITPRRKTLDLVNQLPLEEYLLSVVPGEMPALWPLEALKAQTVVARTDALLRKKNRNHRGYDVCNTAHCAVYRGIQEEHANSYAAVLETLGMVLKHEERLLPTFYSHSCGGMTQGFKEAWWKNKPEYDQPQGIYDAAGDSLAGARLPLAPGRIGSWLSEQPDVFCNAPQYAATRNFRWVKILTQEELSGILDHRYGIGRLQSIDIQERSPSAYVRRILVQGDQGQEVVRGDYIRSALGGLRSNLFCLLPLLDSEQPDGKPFAWVIWGGGWGHGVGLCQVGAGSMARQGYAYEEILHHYFPEGELQAWTP